MVRRRSAGGAAVRVAVVVGSLGAGGAERAAVLVASGLAQLGHQVSMISLFGRLREDFYALPERIERADVGLRVGSTRVGRNLAVVRGLRRFLVTPGVDVVVSFLPEVNVISLLASVGTRIPVVISEQVDPRGSPLSPPWAILRRVTYAWAARLVSASRGVDSQFAWLPAERRAAIHNPLAPGRNEGPAPEGSWWRAGRRHVVGMGRLAPQKGFDLLIEAFARVAHEHPEWDLVICGEGHERPRLEAQVRAAALIERVHLPGLIRDPFPVLAAADLFVLSSRYEGFGNVIIEAMASGTAVLSTDCPFGPGEIIESGRNGMLVPAESVEALADGFRRMMKDPSLRARLATAGRNGVARFELDCVALEWARLLREVVGAGCSGPAAPSARSGAAGVEPALRR